MYSPNNSSFYDLSFDYINQNYPSSLTPLLVKSLTEDLDSTSETFMHTNANGSTSTGSCCASSSYIGSPSSPLSYTSSQPPISTTTLMQPSLGSLPLHEHELHVPFPSPPGLLRLEFGSVKRVFSTCDLDQEIKPLHHNLAAGSQLRNESTSIILESMTKASRYSPEEKKERIERYRNKKSQRNFNKKIQYACRKTLADSRPRVRGRFARNDQIEHSANFANLQWSQIIGEEEYEDEGQWIRLLNSLSSKIVP